MDYLALRRAGCIGCLCVLLLSACQRDNPDNSSSAYPAAEQNKILARVAGASITAAEVDASLRLALHDLDQAKYALRQERLLQLVDTRVQANESSAQTADKPAPVEIFLAPPVPPRLTISTVNAISRGPADAPLVMLVFCDFQSIHCARLQPILHRLLESYPQHLRLALRDFPLDFHRSSQLVAHAARCAGAQDKYWPYHDALYGHQQDFTQKILDDLAGNAGVEKKTFHRCMETGAHYPAIEADKKMALELGLSNVPVVFINGLYIKGIQPEETYRRTIEDEMRRLQLSHPDDQKLSRTQLPWILTGTILNHDPKLSVAMIRLEPKGSVQPYRPGSEVVTGVVLEAVALRRVILRRGAIREFLPLSGPGSAAEPSPANEPMNLSAPASVVANKAVPPVDKRIALQRTLIHQALQQQAQLQDRLEAGRMDLEGKHLLKLTQVEPGGFYDRLNLKSGDVLMQVNGEWVHNEYNPLWDALRSQPKVTLVVMRRGLPQTIEYDIK